MIRFEITNLTEFQAGLKKLEARILEKAETGLEKSAEDIARAARERAPGKSGELRDSIGVQKGEGELSFLVRTTAPHARFVEFGTLRTPARPFLLPAVEEGKGTVRDTLIKAINEALEG